MKMRSTVAAVLIVGLSLALSCSRKAEKSSSELATTQEGAGASPAATPEGPAGTNRGSPSSAFPNAQGGGPGGKAQGAKPPVAPLPPQKIDDSIIVARVNGKEIKGDEFNRAFLSSYAQFLQSGATVDQNQLKKELLEAIIGSELLLQEAMSKGVKADSKAIEEQYRKMQAQAPSEEEFKKALKQAALTPEKLKQDLTDRMIVDKYIKTYATTHAKEITASEAEAKAFYDAHQDKLTRKELIHAHHILRKLPPNATAKQKADERKKIEEALAKLKAGESFESVARAYSTDITASKGGDLGSFPKGVMVPPFEEALTNLKPGETSPIVETRYGFHIIRLDARIPGGLSPFPEMKGMIVDKLTDENKQKAISAEVEKLRAKANVEVLLKIPDTPATASAPATPPVG